MNTPPLPPSSAPLQTALSTVLAQPLHPFYAGVFDLPQAPPRVHSTEGGNSAPALRDLDRFARVRPRSTFARRSDRPLLALRRSNRAGAAPAAAGAGADAADDDLAALFAPVDTAHAGGEAALHLFNADSVDSADSAAAAALLQQGQQLLARLEAACHDASQAGAPPALLLSVLDETLRQLLPLSAQGVAAGLDLAWLCTTWLLRLRRLYRCHAPGQCSTLKAVAELLQDAFGHDAPPARTERLHTWYALLPLLCLWVRDSATGAGGPDAAQAPAGARS